MTLSEKEMDSFQPTPIDSGRVVTKAKSWALNSLLYKAGSAWSAVGGQVMGQGDRRVDCLPREGCARDGTSHLALQKADGTCNTNFKKTQALEQVTKVLEDFVDGDLGILVSGTLIS